MFPGIVYGLGSHYTGGLGANWFSGLFSGDTLKPNYDELQKLAFETEQVPPGCEGLIMLPYLVGSGSPHNKGTDRGAFIGLTLSTTRGALFRSVLEGIAFNMLETEYVFEEMANKELRIFIGGGGIKIKPWPEIIADVFGRNITFLNDIDVSTWGAIRIGAFGLGAIDSIYPNIRKDENRIIKFNEKNHDIYREKFETFRSCYKDVSNWLSSQS
jgi:sugar (pentulose or hexulose) kinase